MLFNWHPNNPMIGQRSFRLDYSLENQAIELRARYQDHDGTVYVAKPVEWEIHSIGNWPPPLLRVPDREESTIQSLFNSLWDAGFRPSTVMKQDAVVEAKNENLHDLRKIVTTLLEK